VWEVNGFIFEVISANCSSLCSSQIRDCPQGLCLFCTAGGVCGRAWVVSFVTGFVTLRSIVGRVLHGTVQNVSHLRLFRPFEKQGSGVIIPRIFISLKYSPFIWEFLLKDTWVEVISPDPPEPSSDLMINWKVSVVQVKHSTRNACCWKAIFKQYSALKVQVTSD